MKLKSIAELTATGRDLLPAEIDLQGWNSDHPIFDKLVEQTQPKTVIEVGSWKGRSLAHFAKATEGLKSTLYALDTWQGGIDHVMSDKPQDDRKCDQFGSPRLYHQFLRNFTENPAADRIFPVQNTSLNGLRLLRKLDVKAELIYVDGSHEYEDVYADLCACLPLLATGGIIFGDDFRSFPGVFGAVIRFATEQGVQPEIEANNYWIIK